MANHSIYLVGTSVVIAKYVLKDFTKKFSLVLPALLVLTLTGLGCVSQQPVPFKLQANRADLALERVRPAYSGHVAIIVLNSPKPGAFCWSNGTIYLTVGLFQLLNDEELCAAIAHEMGHLTREEASTAKSSYALRGEISPSAEEQRADAVAVKILRRCGLCPITLAHVLEKVRDEPQTPVNVRDAMTVRIGLLPKE